MSHSDYLVKKVKETRKRYSMLPEDSAVLVGFSGGADSMALLSVLDELSEEFHWKLTALHVNHGLRGEDADHDEQVCKEFCQMRQIPIQVLHVNVARIAGETGEGIEECGRRIRYAWFRKKGEELFPDSDWEIATAHNANDSVETLLFHLARGTSLKGMSGIPPVRDNIVRPLIECTRAEIETYCTERELPFCTDKTNFDPHFARNRIRNRVLPELEKINPGALECMSRSMRSFAMDEAFLEERTRVVLEEAEDKDGSYRTHPILQAPRAISYRALAEILKRYSGSPPETRHIETLYGFLSSGGKLQIPTGIYVCVRHGKLFSLPKEPEKAEPFAFPGASRVKLPYGTLQISVEKIQGPLLEKLLDYDKITGDFIVRNRRPGDRFRPCGRNLSKPLKALFEEKDIPAFRRDSITILEKDGEIAWMEGFGPSEHFAADSKSQNLMRVSVIRTDH